MVLANSETEMKFKVKKRPKKLIQRIIILVVTLYLVLVVYRTVHGLVIVHLADPMPIENGMVYASIPVSGTLIREEKVQFAPRSGTLKVIVPEGERVRVGESVAQVVVPSFDSKTGEVFFDIKAAQAGIVSYYLDGLEEIFSPANLSELDLDKITRSEIKSERFKAGTKVTQGKPVLKIVNNLSPLYVLGSIPEQQKLVDLTEGASLPVALAEDADIWLDAKLLSSAFRDRGNQVLFTLNQFTGILISRRTQDFRLITERIEGYHVPQGAIVRKDNQDGIYTIYKERVRWQKVQIRGRLNGEAVISEAAPNMKVILNPKYVNEGDPFRP